MGNRENKKIKTIDSKMPQLDQVTFFSQFFWLFFFFIAFYLLLLKNFLPSLSRILKYRKNKITYSQQGVLKEEKQRNQLGNILDGLVERAGDGSQTLFQTNLRAIQHWLNGIYLDGKKTEWKEIHPGYLSYLGEKSLSRHLAVDVALEKMDETRFIPFCVEEMDEILSVQTLNTTPVETDAGNQLQNEEEIYHDWVGFLKQKIEVGDPKEKLDQQAEQPISKNDNDK